MSRVRRSAQLSVGIQFFTNVLIVSASSWIGKRFPTTLERRPDPGRSVAIHRVSVVRSRSVEERRDRGLETLRRLVSVDAAHADVAGTLLLLQGRSQHRRRPRRDRRDDRVQPADAGLWLRCGDGARPTARSQGSAACSTVRRPLRLRARLAVDALARAHARGVVALRRRGAARTRAKERLHNVLDLFSKNCFGVFLTTYTLVTYS